MRTKKTITVLVDDIDGTEGDTVQALRFAIDGTAYDIDLAPANRAAFDAALKPYVKAGRQVRRRGKAAAPASK